MEILEDNSKVGNTRKMIVQPAMLCWIETLMINIFFEETGNYCYYEVYMDMWPQNKNGKIRKRVKAKM